MLAKKNIKKTLGCFKLHLAENKKNKKVLIYILCGYKKYLYKKVFERFIKYLDIDADICLVSSGKYDKCLFNLASKNKWSYLTTTTNNISIAQNAVILSFDKCETIIKMDEDIFVTRNTFSNLIKIKNKLEKSRKKYSFIAPILNVNCYSSAKYLELLNKFEYAEKKFGKFEYCNKHNGWVISMPEINSEYVKFLWNYTKELMPLDKANAYFQKLKIDDYIVCDEYFSIGLILFSKKFWKKMGCFHVHPGTLDLAIDEFQFNGWGKHTRYKRIICQKSVCGHFSYTPTNKEMKKFYLKHNDAF